MGFKRPLVFKITGIPGVAAPANWVRYDSSADVLYLSLGSGQWKSYDAARAVFIKQTSGGLTSGGASAYAFTWGYVKAAAGGLTSGGTSASEFTRVFAKSAAGSATLGGSAATEYETEE